MATRALKRATAPPKKIRRPASPPSGTASKRKKKKHIFEADDEPGYLHCEPLGVATIGDEIEDKIMGDQRCIVLDDGRLRFHHVEPTPCVPDGLLPVLPDKEVVKAQQAKGYIFERAKNPVALGPIVNRFIDGEAWAARMNECIQAVTDVAPIVPFFMNFYGTINAGKSSTLITLLNMLTVDGGFEEIIIGSKSLGKDPMMATWLRSRNPKVRVRLLKKVTEAELAEQARKVDQYYAPYFAAAIRGRLIRTDIDPKDDVQMRPYDSITHPHTDEYGVHHHRKPHLPDYSYKRVKDSPWLRMSVAKPMERVFHTSPPVVVLEGDVIKGHNLCLEEMVYNAVNTSANYQEASDNLQTQKISAQKKNVYVDRMEPKPVLFVMEDAARSYDTHKDAEWIRLCTMIRHMHASAIMLQQKHNTVPKIIRAIETDGIIFPTFNEEEIRSLEENFSGSVPDFRGKLFACTAPIPGGPDRGFMYVKKRERDKVYRSFEGLLKSQ